MTTIALPSTARSRRQLAGRVAIVTGGSFGIGRATALALAREGASVVVVGRNEVHVSDTILGIGQVPAAPDAMGLVLDLRGDRDAEEMAGRTIGRFGRIDILVASAGILRARGGSLRQLKDMSLEEWDEVLDTNLRGLFLSNRAVLPTMIGQRSGEIVNLSSTSGRQGLAYDSAYCASKFGVIGMSEALAEEVRGFGVRVQVALPGAIDTPMWEQNGPIPRPPAVLPVDRVADLIVHMITLPADTMLVSPTIVPLAPGGRPAWLEGKRPGGR